MKPSREVHIVVNRRRPDILEQAMRDVLARRAAFNVVDRTWPSYPTDDAMHGDEKIPEVK